MTPPVIRLNKISKRFGPVTVLKDISLDIRPGEILGVLGENGAGKSTLLKIVSGVYQATAGSIEIDGQVVTGMDPIQAREHGIAMIPQEFNLVPTLRVFENVFLGQERRRNGLLDKKTMRREPVRVLASLQVPLNPDTRIDRLSVAEKQMVEVARVLVNDARVVILDEPTTVLTDKEVSILFGVVKALQQRGVAILFISHKLKEVRELCHRLLILRDGEQVELSEVGDMTEEEMARRMVGRELSQMYPEKKTDHESLALEVSDLCVPGVLEDINFSLHHGQVLGLSGLVGAGRTEVAETLMGLRKKASGSVSINGHRVDIRSPADAHRHGLAYLSEDRQGKGLVLSFNVMQNITLLSLKRYVKGLIRHRAERRQAEHYQQRFAIKAANLSAPVRLLSGGNQQKVYLSKLLDIDPDILILDEPTRGIDINTKQQIYQLIRSLADSGKAVLVISSELEEVIGLCDQVLVMREGRVAADLSGAQVNEEDIMLYAAGARSAGSQPTVTQ